MNTIDRKYEFFQICITVLEAKHLAWPRMDAIVCVQVDNQKKYTAVREKTDSPFYNEYFVFDYHLPLSLLLEKIITLSVFNNRTFVRPKKELGRVSFDVATVWHQPDHQFYHKWAVLMDRKDAIGARGYLKCDVSIIGKGDTLKVRPTVTDKDDDDIEGNLLVPEGVTSEKQRARYMVRIYRADGIPLVINKTTLMFDSKDKIDPYVQISFAGLTGQTSIKSNDSFPMWNEELVFIDLFPPLWQRIKIQLRDSDMLGSNVIATHLLELPTISSDRDTNGFLPTFGPAFIYFYGAASMHKTYSPRQGTETWVETQSDGASYRGRLLFAIETETIESSATPTLMASLKRGVTLRPTTPLIEKLCWRMEEFLLVGVIWEISMLDRKLKGRPVQVEISVGSIGNMTQNLPESGSVCKVEFRDCETDPKMDSVTSPQRAEIVENSAYCSVSFNNEKPCRYVSSMWPDARHRLFHSNLLARLVHKLSSAFSLATLKEDDEEKMIALSGVLYQLSAGCAKYLSITTAKHYRKINNTRLDQMRLQLCRSEVENIMNLSTKLKEDLSLKEINTTLRKLQDILSRLKFLTEDPQHSLPDIFLWLVSGEKRFAFHRLSAREIIFSIIPEERGLNCGRLLSILMKAPEKKGDSTGTTWMVPAKLDIVLWLGRAKHTHICFKSLPTGYEPIEGFGPHHNALFDNPTLPSIIQYEEKHIFEFRAYIYQGRLKPGHDSTALCDPFVRVILGDRNKDTQVQKATLNPIWDETVVLTEVTLYGSSQSIKLHPPTIVIEVYDMDKFFKKEFVGRNTTTPHVNLAEESYKQPCLDWYKLYSDGEFAGDILTAFELLELSDDMKGAELQEKEMKGHITMVPSNMKPHMINHRIEVLFWGLRDMKRLNLFPVRKPRVHLECGGFECRSTTIENAKNCSNFENPLLIENLDLPEQRVYYPPLTFNVYDSRSFGRSAYVGTHIQPTMGPFVVQLDTQKQHDARMGFIVFPQLRKTSVPIAYPKIDTSLTFYGGESSPLLPLRKEKWALNKIKSFFQFRRFSISINESKIRKVEEKEESNDIADEETLDWWTKYYASAEKSAGDSDEVLDSLIRRNLDISEGTQRDKRRRKQKLRRRKATLKIYPNELEAQPEFNKFSDFLKTFDIFRGKRTGDELLDQENIVGKLKGIVKVYRWEPVEGSVFVTSTGLDVSQGGVLQNLPSNDPVRFLVRIYVVRASVLHSKDYSGKSDPYIVIELGSQKVNDKENYIPRQLNPTFGRCFELEAMLPADYLLKIRIMDYDIAGSDDLIGETKIDLENRFYSKHRATCGIAGSFELEGYNRWRDTLKPTQILEELCKKYNVSGPKYVGGRVILGPCEDDDYEFDDSKGEPMTDELNMMEVWKCQEELALYAVRRWHEVPLVGFHLVPEHVETRSLYHPKKPGIEQGKLEMWVDLFPIGEVPLPPRIDIAPRKPEDFELRLIIWNTEDVILEEDSFISGEKMSDIYVTGWLLGREDNQRTDIHYRSLTGEGNFNWRFLFRFSYLAAENKIVILKQESIFSKEFTELKIPCNLNLQVWDSDTFSKDDFLGYLTLDLANMPRGARSVGHCTLDILAKSSPKMNLFKIRRTKGWWPFQNKSDSSDKNILTGKLEAEFQLLTKEEADKDPVGFGRSSPEALQPPHRPETSFLWFKNPLRSLKYICWRQHKWLLIEFLFVIFLTLFIIIAVYSFPGYTIKKLLGA